MSSYLCALPNLNSRSYQLKTDDSIETIDKCLLSNYCSLHCLYDIGYIYHLYFRRIFIMKLLMALKFEIKIAMFKVLGS